MWQNIVQYQDGVHENYSLALEFLAVNNELVKYRTEINIHINQKIHTSYIKSFINMKFPKYFAEHVGEFKPMDD
jgi:hypothetical protein